MILTKFELKGFRGFTKKQTVDFAAPDNTKLGSGITYIVGENNSGKTSILEALQMREFNDANNKLRTSDCESNNTAFKLFVDNDVPIQHLTLIRPDSYVLQDSINTDDSRTFHAEHYPVFVPSRRSWSPRVNNSYNLQNARMNHTNNSERLRQLPEVYGLNNFIADLFYAIETDKKTYAEVIELIRRVFPDFQSFSTVNEDAANISYKTNDGIRHRSDFLGDGVVSVMRILAQLVVCGDRAMIIDEPELSLHPLSQKRLIKVLAERAMRQQIIISTHSPYLVSWEYIKQGAKLNRVVKLSPKETAVFILQEYETYQKFANGENWQQPFLFDTVAREVFFNDNILFLEGQEDVGLLSNSGDLDSRINIFGYGVRGFEAFELSLRLAKDLGIKKAAVILDKGEAEDGAKQKLERLFPKYKVIQWEKNDIRDKKGYCELDDNGQLNASTSKPPKTGYFDNKGKKKQGEELGDYTNKIKKLNRYFLS
jgi:predicted ATP-dependent endonuclease of OLD family